VPESGENGQKPQPGELTEAMRLIRGG